ncbi:hypothetical protein HHK36_008663 [Tetracentron sinense]|uniref:Uncharacterized protein n=1 Tax=Tetracentron sinense TaxID=13715 RepID=A0A834ZIY1_TETSI|nr:hypothetical protein HHK36_008663 [Tetracentron sinense]
MVSYSFELVMRRSVICLDEVQSYILAARSVKRDDVAADSTIQEFVQLILLQYYIERQCMLKCTRQILMHALYIGIESKESDAIRKEALKLVSDGLERKLFLVLQDLLSCKHPESLEVDLATLWAEETLIEVNLVLDILFLAYYESFSTCHGEQWKKMCLLYKGMLSGSFKFGKLAISVEAIQSFYHAKVQLLLILIETLDLENLLQMVHDEVPFRQGHCVFTLTDVQEIDAVISSFNVFEIEEAGPLILAWAVFLCLISSLPGKQDNNMLMEIDHVSYVRQAFEASSLSYFLEILQSDILKDSDGPISGYRSVLRTFVSAFIASYEITLQLEDNTLNLILDILCMIYRGEESLCVQFWDKDSFVDGPIRCLLCTLEGEFPFHTTEFVRFLSSLCEGTWPAECVYNFLDKSVGISSLFDIPNDSLVENISQTVETRLPLHVPGVEGLLIPTQTRGHVLKFVDGNTALIRWEYSQSGVFVLLLRLAQEFYLKGNDEALVILDLLSRLVSFNTAVCSAVMDIDNSFPVQAARRNGHIEKSMRVDVVEIICNLVRNLSPNGSNARVMSLGVHILAKMLKCSPSHVTTLALKTNIFDVGLKANIFDVGNTDSSSGTWLLSGLARMLLIDLLDFTMQLVETGAEHDIVFALVVFSLQYVLVNHEYWKYKVKHVRWKVTLKVLEVIKKCITSIPCSQKLGGVIRDILLCDSSIHNTLCRLICTTTQTLERLYVSRLYDVKEIEGLQLAVSSGLEIVYTMLVDLSKDSLSSLQVFRQAILLSTTKPVPVVTAVISLISFFRNPAVQVGAARVLSMLCIVADNSQPYLFGNVCLVSDDMQITEFRSSIYDILHEETPRNEDLFVAIVKLLTSAARYQPAFLVSIVVTEENMEVPLGNAGDMKQPAVGASFESLRSKKASLVDAVLQYVKRSKDLIKSCPHLLLNVLDFLKALWQGASQYAQILELLRKSEVFWKELSSSISEMATAKVPSLENMTANETLSWAYKYRCQCSVLEIMAYDMFFQKKLLQAELLPKCTSEPPKDKTENTVSIVKSKSENLPYLKDILSTWCESSFMSNLIKSYTTCENDNEIYLRAKFEYSLASMTGKSILLCISLEAKVAASLFIVHTMAKLISDDTGSLSLSLIDKTHNMSKKLSKLPAFSELLAQYSLHGYSEGKELKTLILNDLYYHLQGELEGRKINPGPFKELSQYLLESNFLQTDQNECHADLSPPANDVFLFDLVRLRADLGLEFWDQSQWKTSKAVAERMLLYMQEENSMAFLASSKLSTLKALTTILSVYEGNSTETKITSIGGGISEPLTESCVAHICKCFQTTVESLVPTLNASEDILNFLAAQADLLLHLIRSLHRRLPQRTTRLFSSVCILVLKTSGIGLRVLSSIRAPIVGLKTTMKLLLLLLLTSVEFCYPNSHLEEKPDRESVEALAEVSVVTLGLLPILCNFIETAEYCTLSLATIDLILKGFLTSNTWLPIIQKHLQLQLVVQKLQDKDSLASIPVILKFFLTLARVGGGAEMLQTAGFFLSLKLLFTVLLDEKPFSTIQDESCFSTSADKIEKPQHIWGLGLAVVTAMIYSLGDSPCVDIVDSVIPYFFSEIADLIFYYLNAPDFPSDDHDKKRARTWKTQTSLTTLRETEHTLMLICVLAKHRNSWIKAMKEMDSQLSERSIHLLAFISRGAQRHGESTSRSALLLCPPMLKEELQSNSRPSFVNSRHGWFILSPLGCASKPKASALQSTTLAPLIKGQGTGNIDSVHQTYFSDAAAIQIYRIAFLLLKFLSLQAMGAAKRAEEVGFIDLAHFPELPMPEILHGLQDQASAIVTELCEANKSKQIQPEIHRVCFLLLQIMEKALYLEFCVSQTCGIRPVLGRVEDFSNRIKLLLRVVDEHTYLKASVKSLKQIISLLYPGLLQAEGFL